jgi:hypothetical protein
VRGGIKPGVNFKREFFFYSSVDIDQLYHQTQIYNQTSYDGGYFILGQEYYFRFIVDYFIIVFFCSVDSFNENGVTKGTEVYGPY